jgi:hypothetical protein
MSSVPAPSLHCALDRRAFLAGGLASGALLAAVLSAGLSSAALPPGVSSAAAGDGHIDDAWGHWPPYAHPIPHGFAQFAQTARVNVAAADEMFIT